jgi:hypothetical protein
MNFDENQDNPKKRENDPSETSETGHNGANNIGHARKKGIWYAVKHYVLRTAENGGSPHLLKTNVLFIFLGFVLLSQVALLSGLVNRTIAYLPNFQDMLASVLPGVLSLQTNDYRQENQVSSLKQNAMLAEAAEMKAQDMAAKGYFAHIGPNNEKPWVWMQKVGYSYSYAGENLAINFVDSSDVTKAWINSPAHKKNLINPNFTETGIGTADGMYEGKETTFVVQFFAAPAGGSKPSSTGTMLADASAKKDAPAVPAVSNNPLVVAKVTAHASSTSSSPKTAPQTKLADSPSTSSAPIKFAASDSSSTPSSSSLFETSASSTDTENATDTASSSVLASAQNLNSPEVLGLESSNPSAAAGSISIAGAQSGFSRILGTLFVHPKDVAKKVLFGAMILVSLLLLVSMSHSIAYPMAQAGASARQPNFITRFSHSLLVHKKSMLEVACVLLVMLSVWSLGKTAQLDTVQTSTAIGADSESL